MAQTGWLLIWPEGFYRLGWLSMAGGWSVGLVYNSFDGILKLQGAVLYQTTCIWQGNYTLSDYVSMADLLEVVHLCYPAKGDCC